MTQSKDDKQTQKSPTVDQTLYHKRAFQSVANDLFFFSFSNKIQLFHDQKIKHINHMLISYKVFSHFWALLPRKDIGSKWYLMEVGKEA